jgi:hypothetical protein
MNAEALRIFAVIGVHPPFICVHRRRDFRSGSLKDSQALIARRPALRRSWSFAAFTAKDMTPMHADIRR